MKTMKFKFTLALLLLAITTILHAQKISSQGVVDKIFGKDLETYFMFQIEEPSILPALCTIISVDNVKGGTVFAYANRDEFTRFLDYGLDYVILPHPGDYNGDLNMKSQVDIREISEWDFYPTYQGYVDMMNQFAADYPQICTVFSIGNTVLNRELLIAKISDNVNVNENEPRFLYTSSIHGDETTGYVLTLRLIDYLLSNYGSDDRITDMVNGIEIWINPLANPDGTYFGGNNSVNGARRYNAMGVDMNRNYPDPAAGPHPDGYAWQVETVHFMDMADSYHFVSSVNFHGGTEVCNYPWDTWSRLTADDDWWVYVCREWADTVHLYAPSDYLNEFENGITNGYAWYRITGGRQDYMNYFQQCREFTMEISDIKLLPPSQLPDLWNYNYRSMLNYIEECAFGIRGTVKDSLTSWPIKAEVKILSYEQDSSWVYSTLPNGNYHRMIDEGTYSVSYTANGYFPEIKSNVQVSRQAATELNVKLLPAGVGGIENNVISQAITVYPNPVTDGICRISSSIPLNTCTLISESGKEELKVRIYSKEASLDLSGLATGIYILKFETPGGPGVKKVVVN
jgi:hypothetical protein